MVLKPFAIISFDISNNVFIMLSILFFLIFFKRIYLAFQKFEFFNYLKGKFCLVVQTSSDVCNFFYFPSGKNLLYIICIPFDITSLDISNNVFNMLSDFLSTVSTFLSSVLIAFSSISIFCSILF